MDQANANSPTSAPVPSSHAILTLIQRARFRMRVQNAVEKATTATILAAVTALFAIFAMRVELISGTTGMALIAIGGALIVGGAVWGALIRLDDEMIARKIDRASNLSDRLSTAIAFKRTLAIDPTSVADPETHDFMVAAIRDGVRAAPRANLVAATPYRWPKDLKAAFAFLVISALVGGLAIQKLDREPHLYKADPDIGKPGAEIMLRGSHLMEGLATPVASVQHAGDVVGGPAVKAERQADDRNATFIPADGSVFLGPDGKGRPIQILDWKADAIRVRIPDDAQVGVTQITVYVGSRMVGPVAFEVLDKTDLRNFKEDSVLLDPAEKAYVERILAELKELAKREHIEDLDKFIAKIEQLLKDAEQGKISKDQLLAELAKAEELLNKGQEPDQKDLAKKLAELGKELEKSDTTKDLGKALEQNDMKKAQEELEKLARKLEKSAMEKEKEDLEKKLQDPKLSDQEKKELQKKLDQLKKDMEKDMDELKKQLEDKDNKLTEQEKKDLQKKLEEMKNEKPLTEKQKEELQKQMEKVAQQMQKQNDKDKQQAEQQKQQLEKQIRDLQKKKDEAKNDQERMSAERELNKKKDELQKLDKDQKDKDQSGQREALKRLQRDMEKVAENLQKPQNKQESDQDKNERERQASQKLKDAARETGRVDQDQRKQANQKKMSSQMDDLREALQRAKQKGNKGPNDPFGKQAKNQDFKNRSRGGKGNQGAWKPGQGQPGGQQPGGQGNQPGGQKWGVGHDDNLDGDPTNKSGKDADQELAHNNPGKEGGSRRETILAAAQKGFASTGYKKVYQDYQKIVEDVMRNEKLPSSYRHYVKRYFSNIHPTGDESAKGSVPTATPGK